MTPLAIGIVGCGKIARDQHLPAIAATPGIAAVAIADPFARHDSLPVYPDLAAMLQAHPEIAAVSLCQPPQFRFDAAREALAAGKHVLLEKPPGATVTEVEMLLALAQRQQLALFTAWHSQAGAAVAQARAWLRASTLRSVHIEWKEDVRHWHPGQQWIWQAGGLGVFDPGINALSILTAIMPDAIRLQQADMTIPGNRAMPIAARLAMASASGVPITAEFDFRQTGPQSWNIAVEAEEGSLLLSSGGNRLAFDGVVQTVAAEAEYPALYRRFVDLISERRCEVDLAPLQLVADAFLYGRRSSTVDFND